MALKVGPGECRPPPAVMPKAGAGNAEGGPCSGICLQLCPAHSVALGNPAFSPEGKVGEGWRRHLAKRQEITSPNGEGVEEKIKKAQPQEPCSVQGGSPSTQHSATQWKEGAPGAPGPASPRGGPLPLGAPEAMAGSRGCKSLCEAPRRSWSDRRDTLSPERNGSPWLEALEDLPL